MTTRPTIAPIAPPRRRSVTIGAQPRAVRRHLDWLVSPELALDILAGTATSLFLALVIHAGTLAVWLGALVSLMPWSSSVLTSFSSISLR